MVFCTPRRAHRSQKLKKFNKIFRVLSRKANKTAGCHRNVSGPPVFLSKPLRRIEAFFQKITVLSNFRYLPKFNLSDFPKTLNSSGRHFYEIKLIGKHSIEICHLYNFEKIILFFKNPIFFSKKIQFF